MSRIGKKPVAVPAGVKVGVADGRRRRRRPARASSSWSFRPEVDASTFDDGQEASSSARTDDDAAGPGPARPDPRHDRTTWSRASPRATRRSWRSSASATWPPIQKDVLQLRVGFANEVHMPIPAGLTVTCPDQTHVVIKGADKQMVGQFAAEVRAVRKPEPYKGKGIRYDGEVRPPQGRQGRHEVTASRRQSSRRSHVVRRIADRD